MDITLVFKACIKTIKTRNRAFGECSAENERISILRSRHGKFATHSREIIQQITRLRDFLSEHRRSYLNFFSHLSDVPQMSDLERDKIDSGAQRIINTCSNLINELECEMVAEVAANTQLSEHQHSAVKMMKDYLKQVCKFYSEQRAIRVQRTVEMKKLTRINSNNPSKVNTQYEKSKRSEFDDIGGMRDISSPPVLECEPLSPEELQIFELENNQLYSELNSLTDEVCQIESKVVKIAELQEIFTEKVLEQDKDIDRIAATIIGTTENVKDANEQIRKAIQKNAGLRVWILFFLLVISFSLLFLDWYND